MKQKIILVPAKKYTGSSKNKKLVQQKMATLSCSSPSSRLQLRRARLQLPTFELRWIQHSLLLDVASPARHRPCSTYTSWLQQTGAPVPAKNEDVHKKRMGMVAKNKGIVAKQNGGSSKKNTRFQQSPSVPAKTRRRRRRRGWVQLGHGDRNTLATTAMERARVQLTVEADKATSVTAMER